MHSTKRSLLQHGLSVSHEHEPAEMAEPTEIPFAVWTHWIWRTTIRWKPGSSLTKVSLWGNNNWACQDLPAVNILICKEQQWCSLWLPVLQKLVITWRSRCLEEACSWPGDDDETDQELARVLCCHRYLSACKINHPLTCQTIQSFLAAMLASDTYEYNQSLLDTKLKLCLLSFFSSIMQYE